MTTHFTRVAAALLTLGLMAGCAPNPITTKNPMTAQSGSWSAFWAPRDTDTLFGFKWDFSVVGIVEKVGMPIAVGGDDWLSIVPVTVGIEQSLPRIEASSYTTFIIVNFEGQADPSQLVVGDRVLIRANEPQQIDDGSWGSAAGPIVVIDAQGMMTSMTSVDTIAGNFNDHAHRIGLDPVPVSK